MSSPLGVTREDFRDRLQWIQEELREEVEDPCFTVPVDVAGADYLFIPASLELMKYPRTIGACFRILRAAGVRWTMSSTRYDVTNFGVFLGDPELSRTIARRDIEEAERLQVKVLVTSECGHAYRALRWEAPDWFHKPLPFEVKNIVELADDWVREGRLKLESPVDSQPVTYHDPCNITRNGGVIEEPRRLPVHPIPAFPNLEGRTFDCPCGATGLLCAPNTEPETSVHFAEMGLSDTKADILDQTLSIVWAREWWRRRVC